MMNFLGAAAMAKEDGIDVEYVKVDDDVAVQDSLYTVGRRGVAGTVLVHKVAGAQAERGGSLLEVKAAAGEAIRNIRTMGFALSSCTVPAKGTPTFEIDDGEMELGVGIHGEPGIRRERELCSDELAERLVDSLLAEYDLSDGSAVTLMVNGLGSTPLMELYVFNASVRRILDERGVEVYRSFTGNYMFLSNVIFYPIARLLDKVFPEETKIDCEALQDKIGIFGENHVIGFILGTIIGLIAGQGTAALATGVMGFASLQSEMVSSYGCRGSSAPASREGSGGGQGRNRPDAGEEDARGH